jgi:hypothetical protein
VSGRKVEVDEDDLRVLCDWVGEQPLVSGGFAARDALLKITAALPEPEWEPSDELVERNACIFFPTYPSSLADARSRHRAHTKQFLKMQHAAGLLREGLS